MTLCQPCVSESYPAQIGDSLARARARGLDFTRAWQVARIECPLPEGEEWPLQFMERHFRSAYDRDDSRRGRFLPPAPDASSAVRTQPREFERRPPVTCRSADGCSKAPTVGRFGPTFCAAHGAELERMRTADIDPDAIAKRQRGFVREAPRDYTRWSVTIPGVGSSPKEVYEGPEWKGARRVA